MKKLKSNQIYLEPKNTRIVCLGGLQTLPMKEEMLLPMAPDELHSYPVQLNLRFLPLC